MAFVAALAVVVAAESGIALAFRRDAATLEAVPFRVRGSVPTVEESIVEWQVLAAAKGIGENDVVLVGDSSCLMGTRPVLLEELTGLRSRGLATIGWLGLDGATDVLELALQHAPAPRVVVAEVAWITLTFDAEDFDRTKVLERFRTWTGREAPPLVAPPSRRHREALFAALGRSARSDEAWLEAPRGRHPSHDELGAILEARRGAASEPSRDLAAAPGRVEGVVSDEAVAGLRRLAETCDRAGARLVVVLSPLPESLRGPESDAALAAGESRVREALGVRGTLAQPWGRFYPVALFGTPTHVTDEGAERNTRELAAELRRLGLTSGASP